MPFMLLQYEPNVKAIIKYLKLLEVKVNNETVNDTLQNHPDCPSLLCISDALTQWHIPNAAAKISVEQITELPLPFIAYTSNREFPLAIVTAVNTNTITYYTANYNKTVTVARETFVTNWQGVYLIAEPNQESGEKNYHSVRQQHFFQTLIPVLLLAGLLIDSFILLRQNVSNANTAIAISSAGIWLQWVIITTGLFVTAMLLWYEMDKNNPVLKKVCTGIAKGDCNAILTGKQSKLFSWLSWSEIGFFYFSGGLLAFLFAGANLATSIYFVAWLNILALPYTIFSIYYQWKVAKQWCILCLLVQALLLLGGINIFANHLLVARAEYSSLFAVKLMLYYGLPVLAWYAAKPYLLNLQQAKNTKREYLRIKFNTEIFETLLKKQKAIILPFEGLGNDLGNPAATNILIKVCNPYCGYCSSMHAKIDVLLEQFENLKVKIIFTTPNNEDNPSLKPTRHLMAIASLQNNNEILRQSLDDWYIPEKQDYELFAAKYPLNGELFSQGEKIKEMSEWCKKMDVIATPTLFINGYQLPDAYSIEDLPYFLLE
jgi:uncharacterized membrane protein